MSDDTSCALRLITPAVSEPITLAQAKAFLRIEHTGDDAAITMAITTARQFAEQYLKIALLPQTWDYSLANPCDTVVALPVGPATSITSISLTNEAGTTNTMNSANYRLSVDGFSVIFTTTPQIEKLTMRFVVSCYATVSDIPSAIVQGMLHHIAVQMEQREGETGLPAQSIACYAPFRRISL